MPSGCRIRLPPSNPGCTAKCVHAAQAGRSGDELRRNADSGRCRLRHRFRHCFAGADPEPPRHNRPPLAGTPHMLSTYLLRRGAEPTEPMKRFLQRARQEFLLKEMSRPRDVERSGTLAIAGCPWLALDLLEPAVDQGWFFQSIITSISVRRVRKTRYQSTSWEHDKVPSPAPSTI